LQGIFDRKIRQNDRVSIRIQGGMGQAGNEAIRVDVGLIDCFEARRSHVGDNHLPDFIVLVGRDPLERKRWSDGGKAADRIG
jgi:hypothetical protein